MKYQNQTAKIDSTTYNQVWDFLEQINFKIWLFKTDEYEQISFRAAMEAIKPFVSVGDDFYHIIMVGARDYDSGEQFIKIELYYDETVIQLRLTPIEE